MPDWENVYDLYNTTFDKKQFNPYGMKCITESYFKKMFPYYGVCSKCKIIYETPPRKCLTEQVCNLRIKDDSLKDYVVTKGLGPKDKETILIRSGNLAWIYHKKLRWIFRPAVENGIEMHHIDGDPYNNHHSNIAMTDVHHEHHGTLNSLHATIKHLIVEAALQKYSKVLFNEIKRLKTLHKKLSSGIKDSPRVYQIIDIVNSVIDENTSIMDGQKMLEDIEAAFPIQVSENKKQYDYRRMKNEHKHIKNLVEREYN